MSEKEFNNIIKILLISSGTIVLVVCLFLSLGGKEMKIAFETSLYFKLASTFFFISLTLLFIGVCVAIWKNKPSEALFVSTCKNGYLLVKNSSDKNEASCNLYTDLDSCLKCASDDDLIVIVGKESKINHEKRIIQDVNNKQKNITIFFEKEMPIFRVEVKTESCKCENINEEQEASQQ